MDANPALWADIERDLTAAEAAAKAAAGKADSISGSGEAIAADLREDREYAIGGLIHNGYGAMESVLERLILALDGGLPTGNAYHAEIIRRAALAVPGLRPAMITGSTAADLQRLRSFRHAFRHAYDGYHYERAAENVPIAARLAPAFRNEIAAFAVAIGLVPPRPEAP